MISYQKYQKVLDILKRTRNIEEATSCMTPDETPEQKASAICELFDDGKIQITQKVQLGKPLNAVGDCYAPCTQCIGITD